MTTPLLHRALGTSGIEVSAVSLGSWMTFERMSREDGVAVMRAARESGIDFLDDARYDDRTGTAPIPTGYSEVLFGELFRESGWRREDAVIANKLWLEFWPDESPGAELDGTLARMRFDYLDLVYCAPPPDGLALEDLVAAVGALVASGKTRAWGVLNWSPDSLREACAFARENDLAPPCAAQLAYNHVTRSPVEDDAMMMTLAGCGVSVVASAVLAGGLLSGKYRAPAASGPSRGRLARAADTPEFEGARRAAEQLATLARDVGAPPAALAIAFALANSQVASVLFGATSIEQVAQNVNALDTLAAMSAPQLAALRAITG